MEGAEPIDDARVMEILRMIHVKLCPIVDQIFRDTTRDYPTAKLIQVGVCANEQKGYLLLKK